jgi:hypothetical protein
MVIDLGKPQVFERQMTHLLYGGIGGQRAAPNIFKQLAKRLRVQTRTRQSAFGFKLRLE